MAVVDDFKSKQKQLAEQLFKEKIAEINLQIETLEKEVKHYEYTIFLRIFHRKKLLAYQSQLSALMQEKQLLLVFGVDFFMPKAFNILTDIDPELTELLYQEKVKALPKLVKYQQKRYRERLRATKAKQLEQSDQTDKPL